MKKKIISLVLIFAMLFAESVNLYAAEANEAEKVMATAYLINKENGQIIEVPIVQTDRKVEQNGEQVKVSSMAELVFPISEESGIQPNNVVTDGGVTTRIRFNMIYTQSGGMYRLDEVNGAYEQLDKAFTISNRVVKFISQQDYKGDVKTYNESSNNFSHPGHKTWIDTNNTIQYWIAGYAKCTISRGGSSWDLYCRETVISQNIDSVL